MKFNCPTSRRRALTLIELMLSLAITAFVAGAIASMLAAVTAGVGSKRDTRTIMLRANAARGRLASYIVPARSILACTGQDLVVWFSDSRDSDTVHASEIRWITYDSAGGGIDVTYVHFPDTWSRLQKQVADEEYKSTTDWFALLDMLEFKGFVRKIRLVDGISGMTVSIDSMPQNSSVISYEIMFTTQYGSKTVRTTSTIRMQEPPVQ